MGATEDTIGQVVSWYICTAAALVFLATRMVYRIRRMGGLEADDYLITAAFGCMVVDLAIQHRMWIIGMADISSASHHHLVQLMLFIYPGSIFYITSLWLVKVALVVFYKRLADRTYLRKVYNITLIWLAISWTILFFDIIFYCFPISRKWATDPSRKCSESASRANYWLTITFNISSDVLIICLPITMVSRLNLPMRQKLGVAGVFCLGFIVVITSIIRAIFSYRNETMLTCTVSMIETAIAIIATCLPTLRTLFLGHTSRGGTYPNRTYNLRNSNKLGNDNNSWELDQGHGKDGAGGKQTTSVPTIGKRPVQPDDSNEELIKYINGLRTGTTTAAPSLRSGRTSTVNTDGVGEVVREVNLRDLRERSEVRLPPV